MSWVQVGGFGIINETWRSQKEDTISLLNQIVIFLDFSSHENDSNDEHIKRIGLFQAISNISKQFNNQRRSTMIKCIDTDKSRTVFGNLESNHWFFCEFRFGYSLVNGQKIYTSRGLADSKYLIALIERGYALWCLNYNKMEFCESLMGKELFKMKCKQWWSNWFKNTFEFPSSFDINDSGILKLLNGVRHSSLPLPWGFEDNIKVALKTLINSQAGLVSISLISTNWINQSNWGVIYSLEGSLELKSLLNWIEAIDHVVGLSNYALTHDNYPSLKEYIGNLKRTKSIKADGSLFERSILDPTLFQTTINDHVVTPFKSVLDSMGSFIPGSSIFATVPELPSMNLDYLNPLKYLSPSTKQVESETSTVPQELPQPTILTTPPANNEDSESEQEQGSSETGKFLLGKLPNNSISIKDVWVKNDGIYEQYQLIAYEKHGILFTLLFEANTLLTEPDLYAELSIKLDEIMDTHLYDLIVKQIKQDTEEVPSPEVLFQQGKIYTTLPNIPPACDLAQYQIPLSHRTYNTLEGEEFDQFRREDIYFKHKQLFHLLFDANAPFQDWKVSVNKTGISKTQSIVYTDLGEAQWSVKWQTK